MSILLTIVLLAFSFFSANAQKSDKSTIIMEKAIAFHGGDSYEDQEFRFEFRGGNYSFVHFSDGRYAYTSSKKNKAGNLIDVFLSNGDFIYKIDGKETELDEKRVRGVKNSLNSVIYFASLPYKLQDESVVLSYVRKVKIKGIAYDEIEVRFQEEGGGDDYTDVFRYWVSRKESKIDYLAYVYHTGKGGIRFREAYNDRRAGGVLFQDYNNYKADKTTPLDELAGMFDRGEMELLSKIETESVEVTNE